MNQYFNGKLSLFLAEVSFDNWVFQFWEKKPWKFKFQKCPFFYHFSSFCYQLHRYLSQNWDSNGHFELLSDVCLNINWVKGYDIFWLNFLFFHAWKSIISGIKYRSKFWYLRRKPAVLFSKWVFFQNSLMMSWAK